MSTPADRAHEEFCGCIKRGYTATCWWCMNGQHDKCTANQHGDVNAVCPRRVSDGA